MPRALLAALAATLVVAVPASAAISGSYRGNTNQNRTVNVKVRNGKITNLSFSVLTRCGLGGGSGSMTDVLVARNVRVRSNGTYSVKSVGDSANGLATYELKGRVTRRKVTGSVEQFFRNGCQAFELRFSAARR